MLGSPIALDCGDFNRPMATRNTRPYSEGVDLVSEFEISMNFAAAISYTEKVLYTTEYGSHEKRTEDFHVPTSTKDPLTRGCDQLPDLTHEKAPKGHVDREIECGFEKWSNVSILLPSCDWHV